MRPCACGCGTEVKGRFVRGHHWRARRAERGLPEEKICERCGQCYGRTPPTLSLRHWAVRRFCGWDCAREAMREGAVFATGEAHHAHGEKSPRWKGDQVGQAGGHRRAQKLYPHLGPCARCGGAADVRHHDDEDTANNDPENIIAMCRACHTALHNERRRTFA